MKFDADGHIRFTLPDGSTYDSSEVEKLSVILDELMGPPIGIVPFDWNE